MDPDDPDQAGPAARAVRETLDAVVAPLVREALIADALALAGLPALPLEGSEMREFASGPLREVTTRALGVALADSVTDEILRTLPPASLAWSEPPGVIRSGPRSRPSSPPQRRSMSPAPNARRATLAGPGTPQVRSPPPHAFHPVLTPVPLGARRRPNVTPGAQSVPWPAAPHSHIRANADAPRTEPGRTPASRAVPRGGHAPSTATRVLPLVIVATADATLYETLTAWFEDRARVCRVDTPIELVRHLDAAEGRKCAIIVDGRCPSIRPAALAVLLEEFPRLDVMMCRASRTTEDAVLGASPAAARWLMYGEPASLDFVAAECMKVVS